MIINSTLSLSPQQIKIHLKLCSCAKRHSTSLLQCVHRCNGPYSNVGYNSLHLSRRTYIIHNRIESDLCTATKHLDHVRRRLCGYQSPPSMSLSTSVALALPLPLSLSLSISLFATRSQWPLPSLSVARSPRTKHLSTSNIWIIHMEIAAYRMRMRIIWLWADAISRSLLQRFINARIKRTDVCKSWPRRRFLVDWTKWSMCLRGKFH